jgi:hypothetical protein
MGRTVSSGVHLAEASHRHAKRSNTDKPRAAPSDPPAGLACHDDATIERTVQYCRHSTERSIVRPPGQTPPRLPDQRRRGQSSRFIVPFWRQLRAQFDNANFVVRSPQASGWDGRRFGWTDFEK